MPLRGSACYGAWLATTTDTCSGSSSFFVPVAHGHTGPWRSGIPSQSVYANAAMPLPACQDSEPLCKHEDSAPSRQWHVQQPKLLLVNLGFRNKHLLLEIRQRSVSYT